jgi:hypothetical protein
MKFVPLTVRVNALLPTGVEDGLIEEIVGVGLVVTLIKLLELLEELPPPQPLTIKTIPAIKANSKKRLNLIIDWGIS